MKKSIKKHYIYIYIYVYIIYIYGIYIYTGAMAGPEF